jgi:hypothetical protein
MNIITTTHTVLRWTKRDTFDDCYQELRRTTRVFGIPVWTTTIDREDVPSWALIQRACTGSTEWESRLFKQYEHLLS